MGTIIYTQIIDGKTHIYIVNNENGDLTELGILSQNTSHFKDLHNDNFMAILDDYHFNKLLKELEV